jgi:lysophospholipid acyltransferase (LPLAT)-like uncharacterized protein
VDQVRLTGSRIGEVGSPSQVEASIEDDRSVRKFSWRERILLWLITWAGYLFIRLVCRTLHFTIVREEGCLSDGWGAPNGIWCLWHRSVIPSAGRFSGKQVAVMISRSYDGEYIARIAQKLGYRPVRGSSSRGAVGALMGMRRELEDGHLAVFTIDGPRGPRYVAKPGPVLLAKKTGQPISCFYIAVERAWIVNSWDRMIIPKPFSRACAYFSSPMTVPADATEEQMSALHQQMQETLERCRLRAETTFTENQDQDRVIG